MTLRAFPFRVIVPLSLHKKATQLSVDSYVAKIELTLEKCLKRFYYSNYIKSIRSNTTNCQRTFFSATLYGKLPRVKMTDLLLEVTSWTGFDKQFFYLCGNYRY